MARRYEIEELLWLRSSPLAVKPDKLPPPEEWMGPIPDPATQRKPPNSRDHNHNEAPTNRRPSLFETRHISRGSNSDNIILGPPKTSFASASRIFGKASTDSSDRTSKMNDSDDAKTDRYNFREKFFKDRETGEKDLDRRDTRSTGMNGRRGGRDEKEDWNHGRPRRNLGQDEQDRRPRRNGDADRWDAKDKDRDQQDSGFDRPRDKETRSSKRECQGRGRHEQSWIRNDTPQDTQETEEEKSSVRNREWRRDRQVADRDWNRGARFEQEPEWLDSTERNETRQTHTQEDFQRWKEKMKAGSVQQPPEEKKDPPPAQPATNSQKGDTKHLEGEMFSNLGTPFQMDSGLDKFFGGLLGENKSPQDATMSGSVDSVKKEAASTKTAKSSRFAGLFSPQTESPSKEPEQVKLHSERPASTDADQEGFQRILQMLGNSKSRNTTPQADSSQQPRPPSLTEQSRPSTTLSSPVRESFNRQDHMIPQDGPTRNPSAGIESLLSQSSPKDTEPHLRDRENLLHLMQQVKVSSTSNQAHSSAQSQNAGHTPGILNVPDLLSRPQGLQKAQKNSTFLDDPSIANMQRPDIDLNEQIRRPANGLSMGYYNEILFPGVTQSGQGLNTPSAGRTTQSHAQQLPMGLQRPPGFDQMPTPGWTGQQFPPQGGGQAPLAPPPGIPNPSRSMNPSFFSGPVMHGGMISPSERQPFPRGTSGNSTGNFGPLPGIMPPPGYLNMNGPPPSTFPPMPHNPETLMGFPHNAQGNFGGGSNAGLSGVPPTSRHLLDMFAQTNGGDGRGGMLGPGPFR